MKKFVQFVFTTIFYFLAYGAIHETYDQNLSLLRPCTKEDYLWLIFSFILMSILIYKRTYSTNTLSEKEPSSETERKIVMFIITIMLATSIYFFASAVKILLGFGDNLLHPFSQNPPTESIIVALLSSYYKVVVFIDPLQGLYAILLEILWIVFALLPLDGFRKATTTVSLYIC